ncbi:apolipoprotein A-IV [Esox lucius]|uniref:Apolipoprotein A-IV n=1 Tax=Esox lucius TaxID=8010 RepID=A0AAY5KDM7_ESOLU|nr:apolipoprotein A-IV [Esox lucius]XP_010870275.1 apolipoprotein A-IV [Esox lucius]
MKSTLVAALLVVLAIGCESGSLVKRDIPADVETLTKYFQDAIEEIKTHPLVSKAQDYLEEGKAQITPLTGKIQEHADKIQEQIQPYITDIEGKVRPLAENIQIQLSPLTENLQAQVDKVQAKIKPLANDFQEQMEKLYQTMVDQTKAMLPSQ